MPKLFKLFGFLESSKQINSKGIGLGLHISKKITKMFNGDIICHSELDKGSKFTFIVALGSKFMQLEGISSERILNPIQKEYQKIVLP